MSTGLSQKLVSHFQATHRHERDAVEYEVLEYLRVKCIAENACGVPIWQNGVLYRNADNLLCVRTLENFNERFTKL